MFLAGRSVMKNFNANHEDSQKLSQDGESSGTRLVGIDQ